MFFGHIRLKTDNTGSIDWICYFITNKCILSIRGIHFEQEFELVRSQQQSAVNLDLIKSDFDENGDIISLEQAQKLYFHEQKCKQEVDEANLTINKLEHNNESEWKSKSNTKSALKSKIKLNNIRLNQEVSTNLWVNNGENIREKKKQNQNQNQNQNYFTKQIWLKSDIDYHNQFLNDEVQNINELKSDTSDYNNQNIDQNSQHSAKKIKNKLNIK